MPRYKKPPFDLALPVVVRKALKMAGRTFTPGDPFDWRHYAVSKRRVMQMAEANILENAPGVETTTETEPVTTEPVTTETEPVTTEPVTTETEPVTTEPVTTETEPTAALSDGTEPESDPPVVVAEVVIRDDSDLDVDSIVILQKIAKEEGVTLRASKADQRAMIVAARDAKAAT